MAANLREMQRDLFNGLLDSQYWGVDRLIAAQRQRLETLLLHARRNVPYYETRLDPVFNADGSIDWDRWHGLPILQRTDLIECGQDMQALALPVEAGRIGESLSSGTTGVSTRTTHTQLSMVASDAALYRAYRWHELDYNRTLISWAGQHPDATAPLGLALGKWAPWWLADSAEGGLYEISRFASPVEMLKTLAQHDAGYLGCDTARAHALALEAQRLDVGVELKAVLTRGSAVSAEAAAAISVAFGTQPIGLYSSKEAHKMAHPCPETGDYHVNAELLLLEIVDSHGMPCAPGERGRVVVTPFFNFAQPLIRYEIGDFAAFGSACQCGRTLPVLEGIIGRVMDMFVTPSGAHIVPVVPVLVAKELNAAMWQVAQVGPGQVEIRYVPLHDLPPGSEAGVAEAMRRSLGGEFSISFRRLDELVIPDSGKLGQYVREWFPGH